MKVELPINGGYEKTDPLQFVPSDTVNLYLDMTPTKESVLSSTAGLNLENGISLSTQGAVRQLYSSKLTEYLFAVVGNIIYAIDSGLNYIFGIKIGTDQGYVGVGETVDEMLMVDGVKGYVINKETLVFTEITDPDFPSLPKDVVAFGNRFYVIDNSNAYYSGVNDGLSWNTLNKFTITSYPDTIVAIKVLDGRLYLFGTRCVEQWVLQGGSFPVARDESSVIEYGCATAGSISESNGLMFWLGYDTEGVTSIVLTEGGNPTRVSTTEIESLFQKYSVVNDARSFMYWMNGILFYQINFTIENASFLFNLKTKSWTRLVFKDNERQRGDCIALFNGKNYMGDYENPYIYDFSVDYHTDNNVSIKRKRVTNVFYPNKGQPFICRYLRLICEQGVGLENGQDEIPKILVRISRDNGATFGNQIHLNVGRLGQTMIKTEIYRLGLFEYGSIVLEMEFYNFTRFNLIKAFVEFS